MPNKKELLQEAEDLGLEGFSEENTNKQIQDAINNVKREPLAEKALELDVVVPAEATPTEVKKAIRESEQGVALAQDPVLIEEVEVPEDINFDPDFVPAERGDVLVHGSTPGDVYPQKSVLYTDGNSGHANLNLERAYEIAEGLQSVNSGTRTSGDESLSQAAKEAKTDKEKRQADSVKRWGAPSHLREENKE